MNILVTGFDPFAGEPVNPSGIVARRLDGLTSNGYRIVGVELPTRFHHSIEAVCAAVTHYEPAAILCLGEAGGRSAIAPERVALNLDDARCPDNAGVQPIERAVVPGGPDAYFSTLPVRAIVERLRAAGIPAELSLTAGTFVCNHTFYGLMHYLGAASPVRAGFIHVPYLPEQAARHSGKPSMALEITTEAVRLALAVVSASLALVPDLKQDAR